MYFKASLRILRKMQTNMFTTEFNSKLHDRGLYNVLSERLEGSEGSEKTRSQSRGRYIIVGIWASEQ